MMSLLELRSERNDIISFKNPDTVSKNVNGDQEA